MLRRKFFDQSSIVLQKNICEGNRSKKGPKSKTIFEPPSEADYLYFYENFHCTVLWRDWHHFKINVIPPPPLTPANILLYVLPKDGLHPSFDYPLADITKLIPETFQNINEKWKWLFYLSRLLGMCLWSTVFLVLAQYFSKGRRL